MIRIIAVRENNKFRNVVIDTEKEIQQGAEYVVYHTHGEYSFFQYPGFPSKSNKLDVLKYRYHIIKKL